MCVCVEGGGGGGGGWPYPSVFSVSPLCVFLVCSLPPRCFLVILCVCVLCLWCGRVLSRSWSIAPYTPVSCLESPSCLLSSPSLCKRVCSPRLIVSPFPSCVSSCKSVPTPTSLPVVFAVVCNLTCYISYRFLLLY